MSFSRTLAVVLAVFLLLPVDALAQDASGEVVIGEEFTLDSRILDEERTVHVSTPGNYDATDARYPVLVVLDGRNPFYYTSAVSRFLAANQRIPDLVIVSIANTDRVRDLTPVATAPSTLEDVPDGGGAADFRAFVADELLPWLEERRREPESVVGRSASRP